MVFNSADEIVSLNLIQVSLKSQPSALLENIHLHVGFQLIRRDKTTLPCLARILLNEVNPWLSLYRCVVIIRSTEICVDQVSIVELLNTIHVGGKIFQTNRTTLLYSHESKAIRLGSRRNLFT